MLYLLSFIETFEILSAIKIALVALAFVCVAFIIVVVMKQKGNSDGTEAMAGSSFKDESESFYGQNAGSRKEHKLKVWTYVSAGVLAICCIVLAILQAIG